VEEPAFPDSLNLNTRGLAESPTVSIKARCRELQAAGKRVFDFGLGQSPFPVPSQVVSALKLHAAEKDYLPVRGLPALREAVAAFHRRKDGIDATPDLVLVGPGSKELMFLLQVVFYGELVLPSPCWVSYGPQARILGKQIRVIHTLFEERWRLTPARLDGFLSSEHDRGRPRILVLNTPGNPDGLAYTASELAALAEVARRHRLIVLSDEIYGQIHHRGEHVSIARFYPEGTIVSSGLSKWCGAGGWRLGTMTFPPTLRWLLDAIAAVASETYTSVSAPIQFAAIQAFTRSYSIERYLRHVRRILAALGARAHAVLTAAGIRVHAPEGAFYLLLDLEPLRECLERRGVDTGRTLCERLLSDASVALLPGVEFERPEPELTARLAYVNFDGAAALASSEELGLSSPLPPGFLETHCAAALDGFERIASWLRE
jgi:aspartate aminotransferase